MTEEELINESKITYGSKNNKSFHHDRKVEKPKSTPLNFVSKGTIDPNFSSSSADNSPKVKCEDVHGSEPVIVSNITEPYFERYSEPTESDIAFTNSLFASFSAYVSPCELVVLGKTDDVCVDNLNNKCSDDCFSANVSDSNVSVDDSVTDEVPQDKFSETTETPSQEYSDSSSESVSVGVPNVKSSGTPLETVAENKPQVDSHDTCVDETRVDEISTSSEIKTEPVFEKEEVVTLNEKSQVNVSEKEIKTETESSFQNDPDKIIKDEKHYLSESHASASSDQQVQKKSEKAHGSQAKQPKQAWSSRPIKSDNVASTPNLQTVKRQTCFNCGIPGHIARNCVHRPKVQRNANIDSCASVSEPVHNTQKEPKRAGKGRGNKKPKHQRQAGSPQSSTGSNSPQKARVVKNAFVKPVCNGKCEKYAFDCANKAFEKTGEISEQDLQFHQNKKNQKKSQPQKAPANDKYRHPNSSSSARNVQQNQAQKGPVRPSGPARANPVDQNVFYLKRQTCFNCGIAGHIARNCTRRPYVPYYMQNQRVTPKGNYHSKPMKVSSPKAMKNVNPKVKPSDGDWNAAKNKHKAFQEQKRVSKTNKPETVKVAQPKATNVFARPKQIWKPKSKAAMSLILETKGDLCLKEVSYFDASGNPRTTMAWVPMSY
ncbi:putative transcription factor interactor and regulator CCHC(Zn) family [Helianthus annuus]|nr:putative transcription factor interactor and regulator CCHC(Zn) family [Helianthus annuus]